MGKISECVAKESRRKMYAERFLETVEAAVGDEYTVLGEYLKASIKLRMRHNKCGHVYEVKPNNFQQGNRCPKCANIERRRKGRGRKSHEQFLREVQEVKGGAYKVLTKYQSYHHKVQVLHTECGNTYEVTPANLLKRNCPRCWSSEGERRINDYLESASVNFAREYRIPECRHIKPLPFDFAVFGDGGEVLHLIEFDGEQHFRNSFGDRSFAITQRNDKIKNDFCDKEGIPLLRIPYFKIEKIEKILSEKLAI